MIVDNHEIKPSNDGKWWLNHTVINGSNQHQSSVHHAPTAATWPADNLHVAKAPCSTQDLLNATWRWSQRSTRSPVLG